MVNNILNHRLVRLATLLVGGYIIVTTSRNILTLWSARDRVIQAQNRLKDLQTQEQELTRQIAQVDNPAFVEREARDKLGMVKPGEVVLVLPQDEVNKLAQSLRDQYLKSAEPPPEVPTWQKWLKLFTD